MRGRLPLDLGKVWKESGNSKCRDDDVCVVLNILLKVNPQPCHRGTYGLYTLYMHMYVSTYLRSKVNEWAIHDISNIQGLAILEVKSEK
jgi:hypothetical protein